MVRAFDLISRSRVFVGWVFCSVLFGVLIFVTGGGSSELSVPVSVLVGIVGLGFVGVGLLLVKSGFEKKFDGY